MFLKTTIRVACAEKGFWKELNVPKLIILILKRKAISTLADR